MRQPLICGLVEYPAKLAFAGNLRFSADVLPRQMGFDGVSRVALGHFTPPNEFWRGISAHECNYQLKRDCIKTRKTCSGSDTVSLAPLSALLLK